MALSDEILSAGDKRRRLRSRLEAVVAESGAEAGFLVDEEGTPFATVGHVEFRLPHPLAGFLAEHGGESILGALVGEARTDEGSGYVVERLTDRALVVLLLDAPPPPGKRREIRARARSLADCL